MGVTIHPCRLCPLRAGCAQAPVFRKRARDTGASSITFRCDILEAALAPGRRIVIRAPVRDTMYSYDGEEYDGAHTREVHATITASKGYQFSCTVDPGQIDEDDLFENTKDPEMIRFRRTQKHIRIVRFLNEPARELCECRYVMNAGTCDRPPGSECACAETAKIVAEFAVPEICPF